MALEPSDPLDRALRAAQGVEPPQWDDLSDRIMHRVRAVVQPSEPLVVHAADGRPEHDADGSRVHLASRVVRRALRELLLAGPTHAPEAIDLHVEDHRLAAVALRLVASYGVVLPALGDQVRASVVTELRDLLGPDPGFSPADVTIEFVDVVLGDPTRD